jgi:hypothetical protein
MGLRQIHGLINYKDTKTKSQKICYSIYEGKLNLLRHLTNYCAKKSPQLWEGS